MSFKYKATFNVSASVQQQSLKSFEAKASVDELKELRALLPDDKTISENSDLLYCSFNLAVAGLINANNHGMLPETAIKIADSFKMRPLNIEHDRWSTIGCITEAGFSSFPDTKLMSKDEAEKSKDPFHLSMGGVVWKVCCPGFCELLEDSNKEDSYNYKGVSTSWEVGFDEFVIARGSKNLFTAEIITDEAEVKRVSKYLTQMGGSGFDDTNKEVYMVISGEARGLGGGFTMNPAAAVSGIFIPDEMEEQESPEDPEDDIEEDDKKETKCEKNISQAKKLTVKRFSHMKFKDLDAFIDAYAEASAKNEVLATSDVREFIKNSLMNDAEGWKSQLTIQEQKAAEAAKRVEELQAALDIAKDDSKSNAAQLAELKAELDEIKVKSDEAAKKQVFDSRMTELNDKYDLSDKVRSVIAKSIFNKSDAEFADWMANEGEVILAGKEKKEVSAEKALEEAKASAEIIPNASAEETKEEAKPLSAKVKRTNGGFEIKLS